MWLLKPQNILIRIKGMEKNKGTFTKKDLLACS